MFTEKEKELAKQLKKIDLEWVPKSGDWFLLIYPQYTEEYTEVQLCIGVEFTGRTLLTWDQYSVARYDTENCVWLPLWHQCRKILKELSFEITISDIPKKTNVTVTLWKRFPDGSIEFYQQIVAETDLEAMYQAIGKLYDKRN